MEHSQVHPDGAGISEHVRRDFQVPDLPEKVHTPLDAEERHNRQDCIDCTEGIVRRQAESVAVGNSSTQGSIVIH